MVTRDSSFPLVSVEELQGDLAWAGFFLDQGTCALSDTVGRTAIVPLTCWHDDALMDRLPYDDSWRIGAELAYYRRKLELRARAV